ncbi:MAG: SurA N-terminal domain-containing protein [bacterium]|nr:SurA N-terminal domain-containing protein [bacterium]
MLYKIRKNIKSVFFRVILVAVALTFISWGAGYFSRSDQAADSKVIAKVEGIPITLGEYQTAYRRNLETYRKLFKDQLDEAMIQRLKLSHQALDGLIENRLLLAMARQEGFSVSDAEVVRYIEGHPAFQVGGFFNRTRYLNLLRNRGITPAKYEDSIRKLLLLEQVQEAFKDGIHATETEVRTAYQIEHEQVSTTFLLLKAEDFAKDVAVTPEAIEAFYREHKQEFAVPERRQVAYLVFRPETYQKEVVLDRKRLKEYYELHIDEYRKPERVHARHILLKLPTNASDEEEAKVKARAEALLRDAQSGKDFADLAKANSQGPSAPRGGDLSFFGRGKMIKPFEEVAFGLEVDQVGGPVKTPFGYHVIKVEAKEAASTKAFEEVEGEIRKILIAEEARYFAQDAADVALEAVRASGAHGAAALSGKEGRPVSTTDLFARNEPLPAGLRPDEEAMRKEAFRMAEGEVSDVIEGEHNSYLIALAKREPEHVPPLEAIRADVERAYERSQGRQRAIEEAEALAKSVASVDEMAEAAKRLKLSTTQTATGWFTRQGPVPKIEADRPYIRVAFGLRPGAFGAVPTAEGATVLTVIGLKGISEEGFASARKALASRLRQEKANALYSAWIQRLRQTRQVEVDADLFPTYLQTNNKAP